MTSIIREAKEELKHIRTKLAEMKPTQLTNFFKPFSSDKLAAIQKSVEKALETKGKEIIKSKEKEMKVLQNELQTLKEKF